MILVTVFLSILETYHELKPTLSQFMFVDTKPILKVFLVLETLNIKINVLETGNRE